MKVFLFILVFGSAVSKNFDAWRIGYPDQASCDHALKTMKRDLSQGAENETGYVAFCGPKTLEAKSDGYQNKWVKEK